VGVALGCTACRPKTINQGTAVLKLYLLDTHMIVHISFPSPTTLWRRGLRWLDLAGSHSDHARDLREHVWSILEQRTAIQDAQAIYYTIRLAREAFSLSLENEADRIDACLLLANSLRRGLGSTTDETLLEEMIDLEREALALCSVGHRYRARSCEDLALSLKARYERTGNVYLLEEIVELHRESLCLRPAEHPSRSSSCGNLACSLRAQYEQTGDVCLLDEAIGLEREALSLCPEGHPLRSKSCGSLANSLSTRYELTGSVALLDEAVELHRQALDLCPAGHPNRSHSCANLSSSLIKRYKSTGDVHLLDEAIDLEREAVSLRPEGHIDRSSSCGNLAGSLRMRYEHTGDVHILNEVMDLQREDLALRPEGTPDRSLACGNLAISLIKGHERTGDRDLLNEAIDLHREALDLCPQGHPSRSSSCANLASSLKSLYDCTGDAGLLYEVIDLERESLDLRPEGHPLRSSSCGNLAISLKARYDLWSDHVSLQDAVALLREALTFAPRHEAWRYSSGLALIHLQKAGTFHDVNKAISYLSQSLENEHDDTHAAVKTLLPLLDSLWDSNLESMNIKLIVIYRRLIDLLPLLAHPAIGLQPQLRALRECNRLGSDAFVNAALAGDCLSGLETLELAHSVIWSQGVYRRNPELGNVPPPLAYSLQHIFQSLAMETAGDFDSHRTTPRTPHDMLHARSSQVYALVREIRALPGLDRFVLGEPFNNLRAVAYNHPVVVLVGARNHHYALIMAPWLSQEFILVSLDLSNEDLASLLRTSGLLRSSRGGIAPDDMQEEAQRATFKATERAFYGRGEGKLAVLWHKVVRPVLDRLGLSVSARNSAVVLLRLNVITAVAQSSPTTLALVSYRHIQLCPVACSRYLSRIEPSLLFRLCCFVIHSYRHDSPTCAKSQRTCTPASSFICTCS
jgi:hypothetical protein